MVMRRRYRVGASGRRGFRPILSSLWAVGVSSLLGAGSCHKTERQVADAGENSVVSKDGGKKKAPLGGGKIEEWEYGSWIGDGYWPWAKWAKGPVKERRSDCWLYEWKGRRVWGGKGLCDRGGSCVWPTVEHGKDAVVRRRIVGQGRDVVLMAEGDRDGYELQRWDLAKLERRWAQVVDRWVDMNYQHFVWVGAGVVVRLHDSLKRSGKYVEGLDLRNGKRLWRRRLVGVDHWGPMSLWGRKGKLVLGYLGGRLEALDGRTGKLLWRAGNWKQIVEGGVGVGRPCPIGKGLLWEYFTGLVFDPRRGVVGVRTEGAKTPPQRYGEAVWARYVCGAGVLAYIGWKKWPYQKELVAKDLRTGRELWRHEVERHEMGRVVIGSDAVVLVTLDRENRYRSNSARRMIVTAYAPRTGQVLWRRQYRKKAEPEFEEDDDTASQVCRDVVVGWNGSTMLLGWKPGIFSLGQVLEFGEDGH